MEYAANYRIENGTVTMIHTDAGYYTPYPAPSGGTVPLYKHLWYLKDHLGNNRALVDGSGAPVALHDYDPFGEEIATASSSQLSPIPPGAKNSPYKYGGKEWSAITLDYDFEARNMSPSFHRFKTMDPMCERYYSISSYAYCANNPVNLVDLDGNSPQLVGGLGGALIGGLVGGGIALYEGKRGRELWGAVGGGAVSGAIIGATGGTALLGESTLMGIGHSAFSGAVSGVFGSVVEQGISDGQISTEQVANDGIWGAAAGAVTGTIKAGIDWVEKEVVSGIKQSAQRMENVVRNEVKAEFQQSGRTTGYRNRAQIEKETANRIKDAVSADEILVKAAAETANQVQIYWIGWKTEELNQNLYGQYRNR